MNTMTVGKELGNGNDWTFEQRARALEMKDKKEAEERERAKHSPFPKFAQLNLDPNCGKLRRKLIHKNPSAYEIYDFLVEKADGMNAVVCSVQVLKEALGLSEATIYRAISALKENEFLDIRKSGTTNVYCLNSDLVWKSWGSNHKNAPYHATIKANVILTESEQEKPIKTRRMNVLTLKEDSQQRGKDRSLTEAEEYNESCVSEEDDCPDE